MQSRAKWVTTLLSLHLAVVSRAAFPSITNTVVSDLTVCSPAAQSDVACLTTVSGGLQNVQRFVQVVHDVRATLQDLSSSISTAKELLIVAGFVPAIGIAARALGVTLDAVKPPVTSAYRSAASVDDKLWPYKPALDVLSSTVARAISALSIMKQRCSDGAINMTSARDCILSMQSGNERDKLSAYIETFASNLQPQVHPAVQAISTLASKCDSVKNFVSRTWPAVAFIKTALDSLTSQLNPIVNGLLKVRAALSQNVCLDIPSPDDAAKLAERPKEFFGGLGRKKRQGGSIVAEAEFAAVSASRQDAHSLLKRNWCVSVQDVITGASAGLSAFTGAAQGLLNDALAGLPRLTLPGLPDFAQLSNFDTNFNIPSLDMGIDFALVDRLVNLNLQILTNASQSCGRAESSPHGSASAHVASVCSRLHGGYAVIISAVVIALLAVGF